MDTLNVVVVEDNEMMVEWYVNFFKRIIFPKCKVTYIPDLKTFKEKYKKTYFNLALVDYYLPDGNGMQIVREMKFNFPHCYVAMISSLDDVDLAMELGNAGVDTFIRKPVKSKELHGLLNFVFDYFSVSYSNVFSKSLSQDSSTATIPPLLAKTPEIIYETEEMKKVLSKASRVAPSNSSVLIRGESGTGKELIARMIHSNSDRSEGPFIELNIAALPETLIESELFGHKKGAYTGAVNDRIGKFAEAEGGTIFMDEIGDIPQQVQAKLLRVLQFKQYQRVGDNNTYNADVRILTATSRDLETLIKNQQYREDLYYRLSVISVNIPSLRDRKGDVLPPSTTSSNQKLNCTALSPLPLLTVH